MRKFIFVLAALCISASAFSDIFTFRDSVLRQAVFALNLPGIYGSGVPAVPGPSQRQNRARRLDQTHSSKEKRSKDLRGFSLKYKREGKFPGPIPVEITFLDYEPNFFPLYVEPKLAKSGPVLNDSVNVISILELCKWKAVKEKTGKGERSKYWAKLDLSDPLSSLPLFQSHFDTLTGTKRIIADDRFEVATLHLTQLLEADILRDKGFRRKYFFAPSPVEKFEVHRKPKLREISGFKKQIYSAASSFLKTYAIDDVLDREINQISSAEGRSEALQLKDQFLRMGQLGAMQRDFELLSATAYRLAEDLVLRNHPTKNHKSSKRHDRQLHLREDWVNETSDALPPQNDLQEVNGTSESEDGYSVEDMDIVSYDDFSNSEDSNSWSSSETGTDETVSSSDEEETPSLIDDQDDLALTLEEQEMALHLSQQRTVQKRKALRKREARLQAREREEARNQRILRVEKLRSHEEAADRIQAQGNAIHVRKGNQKANLDQ